MTDLEFIKRFSRINIKSICEENNINSANLWTGKTSKKNQLIIRKAIEYKLAKIHEDEYLSLIKKEVQYDHE